MPFTEPYVYLKLSQPQKAFHFHRRHIRHKCSRRFGQSGQCFLHKKPVQHLLFLAPALPTHQLGYQPPAQIPSRSILWCPCQVYCGSNEFPASSVQFLAIMFTASVITGKASVGGCYPPAHHAPVMSFVHPPPRESSAPRTFPHNWNNKMFKLQIK